MLSDTATSDLGLDATWHAFPRLVLGSGFAIEHAGDDLGYRVVARGSLRLDEEGRGELLLQGDRRRIGTDGWSALLLSAHWIVLGRLRPHASLELVAPDASLARNGALWPWTRVGASYALTEAWQLAGALELKASPRYESEFGALLRVSYHGGFAMRGAR
jgi:hypothetical protein